MVERTAERTIDFEDARAFCKTYFTYSARNSVALEMLDWMECMYKAGVHPTISHRTFFYALSKETEEIEIRRARASFTDPLGEE